jgi:hypothetical protein
MSIRGALEALVKNNCVSAARAADILARLDAVNAYAADRDHDYVPRQRRQPRPRRSLRRVE